MAGLVFTPNPVAGRKFALQTTPTPVNAPGGPFAGVLAAARRVADYGVKVGKAAAIPDQAARSAAFAAINADLEAQREQARRRAALSGPPIQQRPSRPISMDVNTWWMGQPYIGPTVGEAGHGLGGELFASVRDRVLGIADTATKKPVGPSVDEVTRPATRERRGPGDQTPAELVAAQSARGRRGGGGAFGLPDAEALAETPEQLLAAQEDKIRAEGLGRGADKNDTNWRYLMEGLLGDPYLSQREKEDLIQVYRAQQSHLDAGRDADRQINNAATWFTQRSLVEQYRRKAIEGRGMGTQPDGSLLGAGTVFGELAKDVTLTGNPADEYGPGFIVVDEIDSSTGLAWSRLKSRVETNREFTAAMRTSPAAAGQMKALLLAGGFYPGAQEKYVLNDVVFDAKGNPVVGRWDKEDDGALKEALDTVQQIQASGDQRTFMEILSDVGAMNQPIAATAAQQSGGGGGRRSGGRRYGGGGGGGYGGGGGGGVSYTDANELKQLVNAVARSRLGMALTDEQVAEFVNDYHAQEAAFVNARMSGASGMQLDPQSRAAAWIESRFRDQMGAQTANSMITALAGFLLGGGTFGSGT